MLCTVTIPNTSPDAHEQSRQTPTWWPGLVGAHVLRDDEGSVLEEVAVPAGHARPVATRPTR